MISGDSAEDPYGRLSPDERQLLRLLSRGMAMAEVARQLGSSTQAVLSSCELVRQKFGLASRDELRAYALKRVVSGAQPVSSVQETSQLPLPFGNDNRAD
jgi:DNA-binding CsgD family transcriptional regulator